MLIAKTRALLSLAGLALMLGACQGPGSNYVEKRMYDLGDVVDVKFGCTWESTGLGAKVEATNYFGAGFGGGLYENVVEQYGRNATEGPHSAVHVVFYGFDGPSESFAVPSEDHEFAVFGVNCCQKYRPELWHRWRVGGELYLLSLNAGAYVNIAELGDFLAGIVTLDPGDDDGLEVNTLFPDDYAPVQDNGYLLDPRPDGE